MTSTIRASSFVIAALAFVSLATPLATMAAPSDAPEYAPQAAEQGFGQPYGEWTALGQSANGLNGAFNGAVKTMVMYNGDLIVGGQFSDVAGIAQADFIARWDGSEWHALGSNAAGTNGALANGVNDMVVMNGSLYVVGGFTNAANIAEADFVARWSGTQWVALGANQAGTNGAINGLVRAATVYNGNLVVAGEFLDGSPGATQDHIVQWKNGSWSGLGTNAAGTDGALTDDVWSLMADGTDLYVGGLFTNVKGIPQADHFVRWSGTNWFAVGSNVAGTDGAIGGIVNAIGKYQGDIVVGGNFVNVYGNAASDYMVRWGGGNDWTPLGTDAGGGPVIGAAGFPYDWANVGTDLYLIGSFANMSDDPLADYIARFDGSNWHAVGSNGMGGPSLNFQSYALLATLGELFVGGQFTDGGGLAKADYIVSYGLSKPKPDARIKKGTGTLVGNNVYNLTGQNQTRTAKKPIGQTATFTVSIQNDGNAPDSFKVYGTGLAAGNYQVTYVKGTTDITGQVITGFYQTPQIAVGATYAITVKVKVLAGATVGSSVSRTVSASSVTDPSKQDVVKVVVKRK